MSPSLNILGVITIAAASIQLARQHTPCILLWREEGVQDEHEGKPITNILACTVSAWMLKCTMSNVAAIHALQDCTCCKNPSHAQEEGDKGRGERQLLP